MRNLRVRNNLPKLHKDFTLENWINSRRIGIPKPYASFVIQRAGFRIVSNGEETTKKIIIVDAKPGVREIMERIELDGLIFSWEITEEEIIYYYERFKTT